MSIKVSFGKKGAAEESADVVVFLMKGGEVLNDLSEEIGKWIKQEAERVDFKDGVGKAAVLAWRHGGAEAPLVGLIGLTRGKDDLDINEGMRRAAGRLANETRRMGGTRMVIDLTGWLPGEGVLAEVAGALMDGLEMANYRYVEYSKGKKSEHDKRSLREVVFLLSEKPAAAKKAVVFRQEVLEGVKLARDLVNRPAEEVTPGGLAAEAKKIAASIKSVKVKIIEAAEAKKRGFGAYLAVARGSTEKPKLINLAYKPAGKPKKKIILVGKGVTFDSGGLNIKPSQGMAIMKIDMAGAAAVLGLFSVIDSLGLKVEVEGIIPACENMPAGNAYRPGDILKAKNGKTIEVIDTDAEGRLTLADALSWAVEKKPDAVVDLATLTGACMIALGETVAGLWSNDRALADELEKASVNSGEQIADLPMPGEYRSLLDSPVADLRNLGTSRKGDAILAAMFLREFVGDTAWAHIDIAGPAYCENERLDYWSKGATGFGVRILAEWLRKL